MKANIIVSCCLLSLANIGEAAQTVKLTHKDIDQNTQFTSAKSATKNAVKALLNADNTSANIQFKPLKTSQAISQKTHVKYQQYYHGIPVWGRQVVVHKDDNGTVNKLNGTITNNISLKVPAYWLKSDATPALSRIQSEQSYSPFLRLDNSPIDIKIVQPPNDKMPRPIEDVIDEVVKINTKEKKLNEVPLELSRKEAQLIIYVDKNDKATLAYHVQFSYRSTNGEIGRPVYIVDAQNLEVLFNYDNLQHYQGTGPGGNDKKGRYEYGTDKGFLDVAENNGVCTMENSKVKTVNMEHRTSGGTTAYSYTCPRNTHEAINGAYSPLNDAHYFGSEIYNMYQSWYGIEPLTFQLVMRVHFDYQYENAFWDGEAMYFGDGAARFYPFVDMDIASHEIAHGFTEQNSGLFYFGQSGGMNEAFSDIAGEAAEYFSNGSSDWLVGANIIKSSTALRYFDDPTKDGNSINHADQYYSGLDVHYSSGVFNKAFYLLARTSGWDIHKAFDVFVDANRNYWTAGSDFEQGACGVINAADDRGYNLFEVYDAFLQVGVECSNIASVDTDGDGMSDIWENGYGLDLNNPADAGLDLDSDGLSNLQEFQLGTKPNNIDSDGDGLNDGVEVNVYGTDPTSVDSDGDLLNDGDEVVLYDTDPTNTDSDSDGMPDGWEVDFGLQPLVDDSLLDLDNDGLNNLNEYLNGSNPAIAEVHDTEPNNDIFTAQDIDGTFNLSYSVNIGDTTINTSETIPHTTVVGSGDGSGDYFKFTVNSVPATAIFDVDYGSSLDSYIELLDSTGRRIASNDDAEIYYGQGGSASTLDSFLLYDFSVTGTYYLLVRSFYGDDVPLGASYYLQISLQTFDADNDGMPDVWENEYGFDPNDPADAQLDPDNDGLTNLREFQLQTSPVNADSDGDGLTDGIEVDTHHTNPLSSDSDNDGLSDWAEINTYGTNPLEQDSDNDGLSDGIEVNTHGTNPLSADTDNDGLPDNWELTNLLDPIIAGTDANDDPDGDGLNNLGEYIAGTNPHDSDSDDDGLSDGVEVNTHHTSPLNSDTDNDGMPDAWEVQFGLDPLTDDSQSDFDGDGWSNKHEFLFNTDPTDSTSVPTVVEGYSIDADGYLFKLDLILGIATQIGWVQDYDFEALAFSPSGVLYGLEDTTDSLYTIDINTAEATKVGDLGVHNTTSGMTFDDFGVLYMVSENQLYTINIKTGLATLVGINTARNLDSLTWDGEKLWALDSFETNVVYTLDRTTGDATIVGELLNVSLAEQSGLSADNEGNLWGLDENGAIFLVNKSTGEATLTTHVQSGFESLAIDARLTDIDGDGMPNGWESRFGLDPNSNADALLDNDSDGLTNLQEYQQNTSPINNDSDSDGLIDGDEVNTHDTNPLNADSDGDGLNDGVEINTYGTDPLNVDSDNDGLDDGVEVNTHGTNPLSSDTDNDGLPDIWELQHHLDPTVAGTDATDDQDGDGLNNLAEFGAGTNPSNPDTDGDGLSDGIEVLTHHTSPLDVDTDHDGLRDNWEVQYGLDPLVDDSQSDLDGDGWSNMQEFEYGSDPTNPASIPQIVEAYSIDDSGYLYKFNLMAGTQTQIGFVRGSDFEGLAFSPSGVLYAVEDSDGSLYMINPQTAEATFIGRLGISIREPGLTFTDDGSLYMVSANVLYTLDVNTGQAQYVGNTGTSNIDAIAWDGEQLWALESLYRNNFYRLDKTTGLATHIGPLKNVSLPEQSGLSADSQGNLWGLAEGGSIFTINKSTGEATVKFQVISGFESLAIDARLGDADNDGMPDGWENQFGLDMNDPTDAQEDPDNDTLTNLAEYQKGSHPLNADTDGDGVNDAIDAFPTDILESIDTDGDGTGNNADTDDDNDGVLDSEDAFPLDSSESVDTDGDGIGNNADTDDDNDGVLDSEDAFPLDSAESVDTDGDGTGNNADTDDDNDGVLDSEDAFPLDSAESVDTDGDGTGNNADTDDDNDGVLDSEDAFPLDTTESVDTDGDGTGNNADTDDDNDGVLDSEDALPLDNTESVDTDGDGIGNNADTDDDGDGVSDELDAFPLDPFENTDTDQDGIGNNADTDDDNDGMLDEFEIRFGLNSLSAADAAQDLDGDGLSNLQEFLFASDPTNSNDAMKDSDGDGYGNLLEVWQGTDPLNRYSTPSFNDAWLQLLHKAKKKATGSGQSAIQEPQEPQEPSSLFPPAQSLPAASGQLHDSEKVISPADFPEVAP